VIHDRLILPAFCGIPARKITDDNEDNDNNEYALTVHSKQFSKNCRKYRVCSFVVQIIYRIVLYRIVSYRIVYAQNMRPFCFTACNFGSIDQIGTMFGTRRRYFILNITS